MNKILETTGDVKMKKLITAIALIASLSPALADSWRDQWTRAVEISAAQNNGVAQVMSDYTTQGDDISSVSFRAGNKIVVLSQSIRLNRGDMCQWIIGAKDSTTTCSRIF